MLLELLLLFSAGFLGGILNSVAGGGSFITFPALLFVGLPPIIANATNTFASTAGYLSGAYALREEIARHQKGLTLIILISLLGGAAGAWLLLQTPERLFREAIPWLLLFATLLLLFGEKINHHLKQLTLHHRHASRIGYLFLSLLLFSVSIYGGFFNAGLGIIVLSYLALAGHTDINAMNGIKLLISVVVSFTAIILFIQDGVIAWQAGVATFLGALLGGYVAAHLSKQLPQQWIKALVLLISCGITTYFFFDYYAG